MALSLSGHTPSMNFAFSTYSLTLSVAGSKLGSSDQMVLDLSSELLDMAGSSVPM